MKGGRSNMDLSMEQSMPMSRATSYEQRIVVVEHDFLCASSNMIFFVQASYCKSQRHPSILGGTTERQPYSGVCTSIEHADY
jgi:hypothetical protein